MPDAARIWNYTVADLAQILSAFVFLLPFLFAPGYVLTWTTNALGFRERALGEKLLVATPVSISVTPILLYFGGRLGTLPLCCAGFGVLFAVFVALMARDLSKTSWRTLGTGRFGVVAVAAWLVLALISLTDFHWKERLYLATSVYDISFRTAFVDAISRTGVPPADPFFYPGYPVPSRYHYFW